MRRKKIWQMEGIKHIESSYPEDQYKLNLPVHNMNEMLLANFIQVARFAHWRRLE
jgi:hypothetical protein